MQITIDIPPDLQASLTEQASQLNLSLEALILQTLQAAPPQPASDPDDEPEALILESLRTSLQQIRDGKVRPIAQLWDGIDV